MFSTGINTAPALAQLATRRLDSIPVSSGKDLMQTGNYNLDRLGQIVMFECEMIASTQTNSPLVDAKSTSVKSHSPLNLACARLKAAGLRITQPRIAILSALIKRGQPTTIEQIHADLSSGSCDLVTVYRCLSAFEDIGLVRRSFFHNGTSLYTLSLGEAQPYHVICKETNRMQEIDAETTAELRRNVQRIEDLLKSRGYNNVTHVVEFFALAPQTPGITPDAPATR
jgi:Fur family transcriptional regulator, ferric uptake regulator